MNEDKVKAAFFIVDSYVKCRDEHLDFSAIHKLLKEALQPEPIERWVNTYADNDDINYDTEQEAIDDSISTTIRVAVHMKEVI